jgi:hypothetical protein
MITIFCNFLTATALVSKSGHFSVQPHTNFIDVLKEGSLESSNEFNIVNINLKSAYKKLKEPLSEYDRVVTDDMFLLQKCIGKVLKHKMEYETTKSETKLREWDTDLQTCAQLHKHLKWDNEEEPEAEVNKVNSRLLPGIYEIVDAQLKTVEAELFPDGVIPDDVVRGANEARDLRFIDLKARWLECYEKVMNEQNAAVRTACVSETMTEPQCGMALNAFETQITNCQGLLTDFSTNENEMDASTSEWIAERTSRFDVDLERVNSLRSRRSDRIRRKGAVGGNVGS